MRFFVWTIVVAVAAAQAPFQEQQQQQKPQRKLLLQSKLLFGRRCPRGGLCGTFAALMHRGTPGTADCTEYCTLFPRFQRSLTCGECIVSNNPNNNTNTTANTTQTEPYNILLNLKNISMTDAALFSRATTRWESVISSRLLSFNTTRFPSVREECRYPILIDDLYICAVFEAIDGVGNVLGTAGPFITRTSNGLPIVGSMIFDIADIDALRASGELVDVILHEMGHVLGLGTLWEEQSVAGSDVNKCPYTGVNANREFRAVSRCPTVAVPTEQDGGPGTACGHWDEDCLGDELMTGVTGARTQILSKITIASLQDLGYQVDYSKADPFVFSDIASICTCRPPPPRTLMDMIQGETRQMGLGSSGRSRERPRRLSDAARAAAMAYGRKVLDEQSMSISKGIAKRQSTATVTYVGDQVVSVFMQDGDGIFDVVVRKGD